MLTRLLCVAGLATAALLAAGCADKRGGSIPYNTALPAPDAPRVVTLEQNYRIAPLDTLTVRVFKMPDLSGDFEVDLTGNLQLPLIGSVTAAILPTGNSLGFVTVTVFLSSVETS